MVPVQRHPYRTREDGTVDIIIPRYGDNIIGRVLSRFLKEAPIQVHLDRIGTRTWLLCDGRKTIHEIGQHLHREFESEVEPVYERLELFFRHMDRQRLISWRSDDPRSNS